MCLESVLNFAFISSKLTELLGSVSSRYCRSLISHHLQILRIDIKRCQHNLSLISWLQQVFRIDTLTKHHPRQICRIFWRDVTKGICNTQLFLVVNAMHHLTEYRNTERSPIAVYRYMHSDQIYSCTRCLCQLIQFPFLCCR